MKIATWNVNGIKARHDNVIAWLKQLNPDMACLQEIKCVDSAFPGEEIEALGYNVETHGQKGFNGVAILSRLPFDEVNRGLPVTGAIDEQARFIEGVFSVSGKSLRIASLYLPNGNPVDTDRFSYKISWMKRLEIWARKRLEFEEPLILAGDYNVIPMPKDCYDIKAWEGDALYHPESREAFRRIINSGFTEAVASVTNEPEIYTFWDFQARAWPKNRGIRIDHLLLSPEAVDLLQRAGIDRHARSWQKPSDHVPVWVDIAI